MRVGDINGYWEYEKERREFGRILNELISMGLEFSKGDYTNVIRCMDCKYYKSIRCCLDFGLPYAAPLDYCSYGERGDNSAESDVT